jgi:hypothetical protein
VKRESNKMGVTSESAVWMIGGWRMKQHDGVDKRKEQLKKWGVMMVTTERTVEIEMKGGSNSLMDLTKEKNI